MNELEKGLYIISTPIGNLNDITLRALDILKKADFIICENPKHSLKLFNKFGIKKKLLSLHDYNEDDLIKRIAKYLDNSVIGLISDAGSPLISDPGFNLVKKFIKKNIFVTSVPGPTSIIPSLQLAGFAINSFIFFGFIPKNKSSAKLIANIINDLDLTSVLFISGNRLKDFLEFLLNNRKVAICKELTKINETIIRGEVINIVDKIRKNEINLKGEFTVVVDKNKVKQIKSVDNNVKTQASKLLKKYTLTDTVEIVHKLSNISKKKFIKWR